MRTNEDATTQQRNNETVRRLFAAFTANDAGAMDELLAPEFAAHGLPPELGVGAAAMKGTAAVMHAGLHDCHCEIEDLIAQKDRVAVLYGPCDAGRRAVRRASQRAHRDDHRHRDLPPGGREDRGVLGRGELV
jgi:ketosteroid isomerase-like protein